VTLTIPAISINLEHVLLVALVLWFAYALDRMWKC
jgi:hypothetical protein